MTVAVDTKRLPATIGGLVDFAFAALRERARLYVLLSLAVLAVGAVVELAVPAAKLGTPQAELKLMVFQYSSLFIDSLVIAAVALGVGTRVAGESASSRAIAGAASSRWLAVIGVNLIVQFIVLAMLPFSGLGPLPDPPALALITAPVTWIVWGALGIAAPIAALSPDRPSMAILGSIMRSVVLALNPANVTRLCLLAVISIVPSLMQQTAFDYLVHRHVGRAVFWGYVPIDALTLAAIAALQTVFALDFARRAGRLDTPKR